MAVVVMVEDTAAVTVAAMAARIFVAAAMAAGISAVPISTAAGATPADRPAPVLLRGRAAATTGLSPFTGR